MTRSELVERLTVRHRELYIREIERTVDIFFNEIAKALSSGQRVELRGFGTFGVRRREARGARNPKSGQKVMVEPRNFPYYKMGQKLFDTLNNGDDDWLDLRNKNVS